MQTSNTLHSRYNSWARWFCGGPDPNSVQRTSWSRAFCEYVGAHRWGRGVIIMLLVFMILLFLGEAIYYLVGSFRFRDEHAGVWHIIFLSFEALLVIPYFLLYFFVSRWYHLWDASMRTNQRDVLELNMTLPLVIASLVVLQVLYLQRYGVVMDLPILGPHVSNLVAYRRLNFMAGICAAVCCYVVYRATPAFTRKAPPSYRWTAQKCSSLASTGTPRSGGGNQSMSVPANYVSSTDKDA